MLPQGFLKKYCSTVLLFTIILTANPVFTRAQVSAKSKQVIAGPQYLRGSFHQWLWGRHYRKDWATPVMVPILYLDTINGGLMAYEKGGGRQSRNLHLRNAAGKEYVMRSVDKSFGRALPEKYRGTFIEKTVNDQVSIAQPYAALTIPPMASAAGIFHTEPVIAFVPKQPALGEFSEDFGDDLYLIEQRPDENWEEEPNFGNAKNIIGSEKLLQHLFEDNDHHVDQQAFVKARLFDMFIGDWGRHEDQWRWAQYKDGDKRVYKPIPRDRDQVYTKFDGFLLRLAMSVADVGHLESFGGDIKNVPTYNYPARHIDRKLTNEVSWDDWLKHTQSIKAAVTDAVIDSAVKQLPPEIYTLSGEEIARNLKSRRDHLEKIAEDYYRFLSEKVDITGTRKAEYFSIQRQPGGKTAISIFDLNKEGQPKKEPFYSRVFSEDETEEINIYGLSGKDKYEITGTGSKIRIHIIGGPGEDTYIDSAGSRHTWIYDNPDNVFALKGAKKKLSRNPFVHLYVYDAYRYNKKGLGPVLFYSTEDRIHFGIKYTLEKQAWRKFPYGQRHELLARYSINEGAPSFAYLGHLPQLAGRWDLRVLAEYDLIRWNNFFGVGNESIVLTQDRNYRRVRSREMLISAAFERRFVGKHFLSAGLFFQTIKVLNDPGRFLTDQYIKFSDFGTSQFGGARLAYEYQQVNDPAVPMRGLIGEMATSFTNRLGSTDSSVANFSGSINFFLPLSKSFVFSFKAGGATLTGNPVFYQLNKLGGSLTLRGFQKFRFYGESMAYSQTEVQYIRNVRSGIFNGKGGIIGLFDIGRVWQPGEVSGKWHEGYGIGVILAPFGKISAAGFLAHSVDGIDISVRFRKGL